MIQQLKKSKMLACFKFIALGVWLSTSFGIFANGEEKPNVVFIAVDDLNDWKNLAHGTNRKPLLTKLSALLPVDKRFKRLVRYKHWKLVITQDGMANLYNMLHPKNGIGEQDEVQGNNKALVAKLLKYLDVNNISERHVVINNLHSNIE